MLKYLVILGVLANVLGAPKEDNEVPVKRLRVAVIGAGAAGLASARHLSREGYDFVVYEQTPKLGGTWVYTDKVGIDENGIPVHTSMYQGLRTNLPKEVMGFPGFPIPEQNNSYISSEEILSFLNLFCDHFGLRKYIKFNHRVIDVAPNGKRWQVRVTDLLKKKDVEEEFDAVMICNGHYHTPMYPKIEGMNTFSGEQFHSHDYREPSRFQNKRVLVIGAGPSGLDLTLEASKTAVKVALSRRNSTITAKEGLPVNATLLPEVKKIDGSNITFENGVTEEFDLIVYCTGYKYSFPFLSPECGVRVEHNMVQPLYKHMIHTEFPTLGFIGVPYHVCAFPMFDLQARFFLKTLSGEVILPSKEEMMADTQREVERRLKLGIKKTQFHMMGPLQGDYYDDLATLGKLERLPPVLAKLHTDASNRQLQDLIRFRDDNFRIVDSENYIKVN